jgi:protein phosphatase 1 regulatory subunit 7
VEGLGGLSGLRVLDLGANRISSLDGALYDLPLLQELWLGKNKLASADGVGRVAGTLRRLDLQSNRLEDMSFVAELSQLEELYLSHNAIRTVEGLGSLYNLRSLDLTHNRVGTLHDGALRGPRDLQDLWLSENAIEDFPDAITEIQRSAPALSTLYLEHNPVASKFDYRLRIARLLPSLQQLDAIAIPRDQ